MKQNSYDPDSFTSRMTGAETAAALVYLPIHVVLLPILLYKLPVTASMSELQINITVYITGAIYMLLTEMRFLRRDFDPLCDRPLYCILQVVICYAIMMACNMLLNSVLLQLLPSESQNPNNQAVVELAGLEYGKTAALAVFLAPLVEEPIFRGGIFGILRPHNRTLAYVVSMLLFSLYHVWGYAVSDPVYWLYLLQYLPVSWLLCRCYERCNSIWGSIFLHMTINAVSIYVLTAMAGYL